MINFKKKWLMEIGDIVHLYCGLKGFVVCRPLLISFITLIN